MTSREEARCLQVRHYGARTRDRGYPRRLSGTGAGAVTLAIVGAWFAGAGVAPVAGLLWASALVALVAGGVWEEASSERRS